MKPKSFNRDMKRELAGTFRGPRRRRRHSLRRDRPAPYAGWWTYPHLGPPSCCGRIEAAHPRRFHPETSAALRQRRGSVRHPELAGALDRHRKAVESAPTSRA